MPLEVAAHAGFCMGVRRAVEMAEQAAQDGIPSCTLGDLIHNPCVVAELEKKGLVSVHTVEEAGGRRVLIRSHGVSRDVMEQLENTGCEVLDLTWKFRERPDGRMVKYGLSPHRRMQQSFRIWNTPLPYPRPRIPPKSGKR